MAAEDVTASPGPALDPAVVAELRRAQDACGNPEFIAQLAGLFRQHAPARLASIAAAVAGHDGATLGHTAHTLKSNGAMLGAARFAELCAALEACGDTGRFDGAAPLVDRAKDELERVLQELATLAAPAPRRDGPEP